MGVRKFLSNLSIRLWALGRRAEAFDAAEEAVKVYRDLAATCPDAYGPELAVALHNLSECLTEFGRREEALDAIEDAVANLRRPFLQTLSAFAKEMETIIASYTERCAESNREVEAELLAPITEALARLKDDRPGKSA